MIHEDPCKGNEKFFFSRIDNYFQCQFRLDNYFQCQYRLDNYFQCQYRSLLTKYLDILVVYGINLFNNLVIINKFWFEPTIKI